MLQRDPVCPSGMREEREIETHIISSSFFCSTRVYCSRVISLRSRHRVVLVCTRGINCVGRDAYEGN